MALSNWDILFVDEEGKELKEFRSKLGLVIEPYKNWLHINHDSVWREGGNYICPVIGKFCDGTLDLYDTTIVATRGPRNGMYGVAWTDKKYCLFICCYGYSDKAGRHLGITKKQIKFLQTFLKKYDKESYIPKELLNVNFSKSLWHNQGDKYFGGSSYRIGVVTKTILERCFLGGKRK